MTRWITVRWGTIFPIATGPALSFRHEIASSLPNHRSVVRVRVLKRYAATTHRDACRQVHGIEVVDRPDAMRCCPFDRQIHKHADNALAYLKQSASGMHWRRDHPGLVTPPGSLCICASCSCICAAAHYRIPKRSEGCRDGTDALAGAPVLAASLMCDMRKLSWRGGLDRARGAGAGRLSDGAKGSSSDSGDLLCRRARGRAGREKA